MSENIEKTYELRNLEADDLFIMIGIISKIGIKEFKGCFESDEVKAAITNVAKQKKDADANEDADDDVVASIGISVALDIAAILLANIGKCKNDIYALLANLSGVKEKEIAKLPIKTFTGMIFDLVKKKEFADFFQDAAKFLK
nr:MAG TPA: hypothetical protein [Caudoviricetes sp.]